MNAINSPKFALMFVCACLLSACSDEVKIDPNTFETRKPLYATSETLDECKADFNLDRARILNECVARANVLSDEAMENDCHLENQRLKSTFFAFLKNEVRKIDKDRHTCLVELLGSTVIDRVYAYCDQRYADAMDELRKTSCTYDGLVLIDDVFEWRVIK